MPFTAASQQLHNFAAVQFNILSASLLQCQQTQDVKEWWLLVVPMSMQELWGCLEPPAAPLPAQRDAHRVEPCPPALAQLALALLQLCHGHGKAWPRQHFTHCVHCLVAIVLLSCVTIIICMASLFIYELNAQNQKMPDRHRYVAYGLAEAGSSAWC